MAASGGFASSFLLFVVALYANVWLSNQQSSDLVSAVNVTRPEDYNRSRPLIVKVGTIYEPDSDRDSALAAMIMAETSLHNAGIIPAWISFKYEQRQACYFQLGLGAAIDLYYNNSIDVLIGPACDDAMLNVALIGTFWNLPVIGYATTDNGLSDTATYRSFARTIAGDDQLTLAIQNAIITFGWIEFGLVYNDDGRCDSFIEAWNQNLQILVADDNLVNVSQNVIISFNWTGLDLQASQWKFGMMKSQARIFVVCPGLTAYEFRPFLLKLAEQNMTRSDYYYLVPWLQKNIMDTTPLWQGGDGKDAIAKAAFKFVMVFDQSNANATSLQQFNQRLLQTMQGALLNSSITTANASPFITYFHDALYLYGIALNRSISAPGFPYHDGRQMIRLMINTSFIGASGLQQIDSNGTHVTYFTLTSWDSSSGYSPYANSVLLPPDNYGYPVAQVNELRKMFWATPDGKAPVDTPTCGYTGDSCPAGDTTVAIVAPVVCILVVITVIALLIMFRVRQIATEKELLKMSWKIERHEIHRITKGRQKGEDPTGSSASGSEASSSSKSGELASTSSSGGEGGKRNAPDNGILLYNKATFIGVGDFRDIRVACKQIRQFQVMGSFSKKELLTLHAIREMRHENVNPFIGIVLTPPPGLVVWGYNQRGSLDDILYNEHIELDMMFKSSLMRDLVKGLEYIHRSVVLCHGSLTTTNCVVDARWVLKLTDFGLNDVLNKLQMPGKSLNEVDDQVYSQSMYHMAPEILRQAFERRTTSPTREADIYSLGMILFQILYREQPFTNMTIPPAEIIRKIAYPGPSYQIIRPTLPKRSGVNHGFTVLLNLAWDEITASRPQIMSIKESVYALTKQYNANIIDHVIKLMEQYTQNLEKVVEERTKELEAERMKADLLLREMLPKSVVDDLKAGKTVLPETYEACSIYFSDIMQFTYICMTSTPLEVVTMLNQLYSNFDNITKQYDVYKVETIGDAYMVASGLPIRNGPKHVFELCNMALHIRKFVQTEFKVPHRPAEKIDIRIGIHSGPAAAGVIGLAMPRYCVFGDTVNTASRMESTGEAMKIQVTTATATLLEQRREYLLEKRGLIEVKGKGLQETFWLIDRIPVVEKLQ